MSAAPAPPRVRTTLVTGASGAVRERAIMAALERERGSGACAVILEGLPDGRTFLVPSATVLISRIAPGCLCCTGNLVLRVTLNRLLRPRPERLFVGLAATEHLDQLRSWLNASPYDQLLELTPDFAT